MQTLTFNYNAATVFNQTQPLNSNSLVMQKAHSHNSNKSMMIENNPFKNQEEKPCFFGLASPPSNANSFNPFKSAQKKGPLYGGGSPLRPRTGSQISLENAAPKSPQNQNSGAFANLQMMMSAEEFLP